VPCSRRGAAELGAPRLSSVTVDGILCDATAASMIALLRPHFLGLVAQLGLSDSDAAAINATKPRELTQRVASWLYPREGQPDRLWDGLAFVSSHDDELRRWTIVERPGDRPFSRLSTIETESEIARSNPDLEAAFALRGLTWEPLHA